MPVLNNGNVVVDNITKGTMLAGNTLLMGEVKRDHVILGVDNNIAHPLLNSVLKRFMRKKR